MKNALYLPDGSLHHFAQSDTVNPRLSQHIASRSRSPDFSALGMILPNPDPILRRLGKSEAVYRELLGDAHVGGTARRRKGGVQAMERRVVAKSTRASIGRPQAASATALRLCQDALSAIDLHALIADAMAAPLFGWQPLEVMWAQSGKYLVPSAVLAKPQEWFVFGPEGQLRFRSRDNPFWGEDLPERKFLLARQDPSYTNPYGFADLSMCFWPTTFKRGGLKFWVTFAEKFGTPWVVGKQPRSAGLKEAGDLLDQLEAMVQDAVAVIPDDASVDIHSASGKGDAANAYERLLMFCRSEVSIALLGQNQSTEASSTHASAAAGLEVAKDLRDADAHLIESTLNQLMRWVVDVNLGPDQAAPLFELFEEEEVSDLMAKRDQALAASGARFSPAYYQRAYGLEEGDLLPPAADPRAPRPLTASTEEAALASSTKAPAFSEPSNTLGLTDSTDATDAIDEAIAQELGDWQPLVAPAIDTLQTLITRADREGWSAAQLIAALPSLVGQLNTEALGQSLERTATGALIGAMLGANLDPATKSVAGAGGQP